MNGQIDFLKGYQVGLAKKTQALHRLQVGSFLALLAYCLMVGATFSYWLFINKQASGVQQEIAQKKQQIEKLKDVESLQIVLKQRLSTLGKFFSTQKETNFEDVLSLLGQITDEVKIKELKMSEGKINLSGEAPNNLALEKFIQDLKNKPEGSLFSTITLSSLDRQENGGYFFSLVLETKG